MHPWASSADAGNKKKKMPKAQGLTPSKAIAKQKCEPAVFVRTSIRPLIYLVSAGSPQGAAKFNIFRDVSRVIGGVYEKASFRPAAPGAAKLYIF